MEFGRYLVLSTAHIRCATAERLEGWARLPAIERPLAVASTHYGWFVATRELSLAEAAHLPEELPALLAFARTQDCAYILLDCDGPEESHLPVFPW